MNPPLQLASLYGAEVMHQRFVGAAYRFRYRVFSLLLDIDAIDAVAAATPLFSHNRFNLLSFYDRDHLPPGVSNLRVWAERTLATHGIDGRPLRIRLLCFPRLLGWVFNPLSLWYCEDAARRPVAVIAEVRNTFGERHCYLLRPQAAQPDWPLRARHVKDFHVSPFIAMQASYAFELARPEQSLRVLIREFQGDRLVLVASQTGQRRPFTTAQLLWQTLRVPLQTLKVIAAIHWQALRIWLQGARLHKKPAPPAEEVS